jgi:YVTN family beta-propeller protein
MRRLHILRSCGIATVIFAGYFLDAADFVPPAGERFPLISAAGSILPGGRFLKPVGAQIPTGPAPSAMAVSPKGAVATADIGLERHGITVLEPGSGKKPPLVDHLWARTPHGSIAERADPDWTGVAAGIAFEGDKAIWISEGLTGRVRQVDAGSGDKRKVISLNNADWSGSVTSALVFDSTRRLLYVADSANGRVAVIDTRKDRVTASAALGKDSGLCDLALSPDGSTLYAAAAGAVAAIDVRNPLAPEIKGRISASGCGGILALADRVYTSDPASDTIAVIAAGERTISAEIHLAIPGLEKLRGIQPRGLAYDPLTKWLLVAESGVNTVGVVDTTTNQLIGHIPVGWNPNRVAIFGDRVYVTNARGRGTGPYLRQAFFSLGEVAGLHRGMITTFIVPDAKELARDTGVMMALNGFVPVAREAFVPPAGIRHVVVILKNHRTFDEVLGDITKAGNGNVAGSPPLARFGMHGVAHGAKMQFSVKDAAITPNQHAIARQWAFSDNFYVDGEDTDAEDGTLAAAWEHLQKSGVTVRRFENAEGIPDQVRADRFIAALEQYRDLPQVLIVRLPNDRTGEPAEGSEYPYAASFVEDNDLATGRIVESLSRSRWWKETVVLITETDTEGSFDHIDSHRTLLLAAGPSVKKDYVSHTNASFPALLRTVFAMVGAPPESLADATAPDLRDLFTSALDTTPYIAIAPDKRIFDPNVK